METPKFGKFLSAIIGFLLGLALCFFASVIRTFFPPLEAVDWAEEQRVTSPDGKFDAILVREGLGGRQVKISVAGICMRLKRPNRVRSKKNIRSSAQTHCGGKARMAGLTCGSLRIQSC